MRFLHLLSYAALVLTATAQTPATPNLDAQRAAMKKLGFLVGKWSGEARIFRGDQTIEVTQTEEAGFKLDGLLLTIEGVGKTQDNRPALQAFGIISYDHAAGVYRFRAFNDGRWLESAAQLSPDGNVLTWGFVLGNIKTHSILRMNDKGEWTEQHEIIIGDRPAKKLIEIIVRRGDPQAIEKLR